MSERIQVGKLLVLHGPALESQGFLEFLSRYFEVELAEKLDDALSALRQKPFTAVLAETADFLPLERGVVTQQAAIVLDTLGDGVCIVGPGGDLAWANERAKSLPPEVMDRLRKTCALAYEEIAAAGRKDPHRGKRFSMMMDDGTYYEVLASPVFDRQGALRQVAAVIVDATHQRRQQLKLNAIDRAGRELVGLDHDGRARGDAAQRLNLLADRIIRYSRDVLDYQHFALLLWNEQTNRLEVLISEGLGEPTQKRELFASTEGNGICGYVAATGRSYVCPDVGKDKRYLPGLPGARSSLTVPLRLHDRVIGVLNVESARPGAFTEEDRQFADIFANYIALALHILNLLASERSTAQERVSGCISAELAAPLNDIVTEALEMMEDYIGYDDLRRGLEAIVDLACTARKSVQRLAEAPGEAGLEPPRPPVPRDPALEGKAILVADDEELTRHTIRDVLAGCGCRVDTAADGKEAIDRLRARSYDLVITDINMPGASGYDIFAEAKKLQPSVRVVMITAFGCDRNHTAVRAHQEGLGNLLMKPFKVDQLLDACRSVLGNPAK